MSPKIFRMKTIANKIKNYQSKHPTSTTKIRMEHPDVQKGCLLFASTEKMIKSNL